MDGADSLSKRYHRQLMFQIAGCRGMIPLHPVFSEAPIRGQMSGIRNQESEKVTGGFAAAKMLGRVVFFLTRRFAPPTFLIPDI
jgi:hypothetical protein